MNALAFVSLYFFVLTLSTGPGYNSNYGSAEVGYAGNGYPVNYGINPVSLHSRLKLSTLWMNRLQYQSAQDHSLYSKPELNLN